VKQANETKKEKKVKEKRRGSFTDLWRARKTSNADTLPKSPLSSPPTSPTLAAVSESEPATIPVIDLNTSVLVDSSDFVVVTPPPQLPLEEVDLPMMRDESLIFTEKHMHQVTGSSIPPICYNTTSQLRRYMPGYTKWLDWKLLYCTQTHGIR
jgi:hypothetical protein